MPPRPGRILRQLSVPFGERGLAADPRSVKSSPDFVAAREEVLSMIWEIEEQKQAGEGLP